MPHNKYIEEFLQTTCNQIRFKGVHKSIVNELTDHIEEQKDEYISQGLDEETAIKKAVEEMGDPVLVGRQLDETHRPRTEWPAILLAIVLVVIGGAVQFFISGYDKYQPDLFMKFLVYAPIGIGAFLFVYFFDYTLFGKYSKQIYFILLAINILDMLFISNDTNGISYGVSRHGYYFALLFIPAYAGIIYSYRNKGYWGIVTCGVFYAAAAFMCLRAPSFIGFMILSISCLILITIAIIKGYFGGSRKVGLSIACIPTISFTVTVIFFVVLRSPYRIARITNLIHPGNDPMGRGWRYMVVHKILAASKPFGKEVLHGEFGKMPIYNILPSSSTDFLLTYIFAMFGYAAGIAIIIILAILIGRMFVLISKQKNVFGFLVSCAAFIAITLQFVLFVLSNMGMLTPLSVALPLISYGGMGFIVNMIFVGLVLSVYRRTDIVVDRLQKGVKNRGMFVFEEGKLIIDLGFKFLKKNG